MNPTSSGVAAQHSTGQAGPPTRKASDLAEKGRLVKIGTVGALPYSLSILGSRFDLSWVYLGGFLLINLKLDIWNGIDVCMVVGRYLKLRLP